MSHTPSAWCWPLGCLVTQSHAAEAPPADLETMQKRLDQFESLVGQLRTQLDADGTARQKVESTAMIRPMTGDKNLKFQSPSGDFSFQAGGRLDSDAAHTARTSSRSAMAPITARSAYTCIASQHAILITCSSTNSRILGRATRTPRIFVCATRTARGRRPRAASGTNSASTSAALHADQRHGDQPRHRPVRCVLALICRRPDRFATSRFSPSI